ncbi:MAG: response regulator [Gammaproteobacteria bacterium]|nr:response regulator [Gammaproteobacteria bacterium]
MSSITTDITDSKKQDEIVRRSQKMDALGKLVGGIAHDYNNMLGVVIGYADLLSEVPENSPKQEKYIKQIRHSARRGAQLTKQLLQFSGRGVGEATALDINQLLLDTKSLLEKTLTPKISIDFQLDQDLYLAWLDSNALEDAILNLSINAMHAIDGTGGLTIKTTNTHLNGETRHNIPSLSDGDYVMLSFSDTGCGMNSDILEKIFDPFFTTKGELGTGLGLSQVYGFVRQSGGAITVDSAPGEGTEIKLYFPSFDQQKVSFEEPSTAIYADLSGSESVLLVDDEIALLELASETLERQGYRTFCASSAEDALKLLEAENIDLMISDVVMPNMDGYQLAALVQKKHPSVKIRMASGYSESRHVSVADQELHEKRMTKPYDATELLRQVRELVDS